MTQYDIISKLMNQKTRSAWDRGVTQYAVDLLADVETEVFSGLCDRLRAAYGATTYDFDHYLMNGAQNWKEYSYGGSALCYDGDIAERLCAPWELRRTHNGANNPNSRESWLDVQARALYQAAVRIRHAVREAD